MTACPRPYLDSIKRKSSSLSLVLKGLDRIRKSVWNSSSPDQYWNVVLSDYEVCKPSLFLDGKGY